MVGLVFAEELQLSSPQWLALAMNAAAWLWNYHQTASSAPCQSSNLGRGRVISEPVKGTALLSFSVLWIAFWDTPTCIDQQMLFEQAGYLTRYHWPEFLEAFHNRPYVEYQSPFVTFWLSRLPIFWAAVASLFSFCAALCRLDVQALRSPGSPALRQPGLCPDDPPTLQRHPALRLPAGRPTLAPARESNSSLSPIFQRGSAGIALTGGACLRPELDDQTPDDSDPSLFIASTRPGRIRQPGDLGRVHSLVPALGVRTPAIRLLAASTGVQIDETSRPPTPASPIPTPALCAALASAELETALALGTSGTPGCCGHPLLFVPCLAAALDLERIPLGRRDPAGLRQQQIPAPGSAFSLSSRWRSNSPFSQGRGQWIFSVPKVCVFLGRSLISRCRAAYANTDVWHSLIYLMCHPMSFWGNISLY